MHTAHNCRCLYQAEVAGARQKGALQTTSAQARYPHANLVNPVKVQVQAPLRQRRQGAGTPLMP